MLDVSGDIMEIVLGHLYRANDPELDTLPRALALLPLAHRLELDDLQHFAASSVIENLSDENMLDCVNALKPFRDSKVLKKYWDFARDMIAAKRDLVETLMVATKQS